jgi:hypothetical protein
MVFKIKFIRGKAIPVTGREDPQGCETSRLLHFLDSGSQMAVRLSALRAGHPVPPGRFLVYSFLLEAV